MEPKKQAAPSRVTCRSVPPGKRGGDEGGRKVAFRGGGRRLPIRYYSPLLRNMSVIAAGCGKTQPQTEWGAVTERWNTSPTIISGDPEGPPSFRLV
jgi:hypothetical protein